MKIRRKQRQKRTHAIRWIILVSVIALVFAGYWGVRGVLSLMDSWTEDLPSIDHSTAFNYAQKSTMLAADGTTVLAEFQLENREPLSSLDQISPYAVKGTVDTEDTRFYEHDGVDLYGIARAFVNNIVGGDLEGASTITQQLVRNTILSEEATDISLERKIREAELALEMEKTYSKDEILLMYMNTINYGDGCYGIEAAAQHYLQKSASELTLSEAAMLVGIPQSPTYLAPTTNPEACLARRNTVLDRMLSAGDITQAEHDAAKAEPLSLNPAPANPADGIHAYPYFTSYARQWLLDNYSSAEIFEGGLTIYTTLDPAMQQEAEAACQRQYERMDVDYEAGIVAVDPNTGFVKAMVGGRDYYTDQYNIATGKGRPTGSSFKMFTLVTAIEQGINPQTYIDCTSPITLSDGTTIENIYGIDYGWRSIASATNVSSNTGYIRLQNKVGTANVIETAHRMGITSDLPNVTSLSLGVADINLLQMAQAYGVLATGGILHDSVVVSKIVDKNGVTIYEAPQQGERVLSEEVAGAATKVLQGVFNTSEGTANSARLASGQPVAGKTGTAENFYDHWLVGYTPDLVCATWLGERYNQASSSYVDCNAMFKDFMSNALAKTPVKQFPTVKDPSYTSTEPIGGFGSKGYTPEKDDEEKTPPTGPGTTEGTEPGTGTTGGTGGGSTGGTGTGTGTGEGGGTGGGSTTDPGGATPANP